MAPAEKHVCSRCGSECTSASALISCEEACTAARDTLTPVGYDGMGAPLYAHQGV